MNGDLTTWLKSANEPDTRGAALDTLGGALDTQGGALDTQGGALDTLGGALDSQGGALDTLGSVVLAFQAGWHRIKIHNVVIRK